MKILVLNSRSSGQKTCLYEIGERPAETRSTPLREGKIEWRTDSAWVSVKNQHGGILKEKLPVSSREKVIRRLLRAECDKETRAIRSEAEIDVVGHRLVHGGPQLTEPVTFTPEVHSAIRSVSAFAPLHIQAQREGVRILEQLLGVVPQVALFVSRHDETAWSLPLRWVSRLTE